MVLPYPTIKTPQFMIFSIIFLFLISACASIIFRAKFRSVLATAKKSIGSLHYLIIHLLGLRFPEDRSMYNWAL